jgi:hypothetical protein
MADTQVEPTKIDLKAEPVPITEPEKFGANNVQNVNYMDQPDYHRVAEFLDIGYEDRKDEKMAQKLSVLYDWAKEETGSDDRIKRLEAIKGLQKRLGIWQTGKETIKQLYQYVRLDQDRKRIEREMGLVGTIDNPSPKL